MAQSWYSVVESEMASVDETIKKGIRSSYPELNDMCEAALNHRYHEVRPALSILSYYLNGGKDPKEAVANAVCFKASFDGLHMHDLIDENGKVLATRKKKLFEKEPSTTKVIVAGDFLYVMGFRQAYSACPKAVPYMIQASSAITNAIFDIVNDSRNPEISCEKVMEIIRKKNAIEFQIILESAAAQAGADEEALKRMRVCGCHIGTAIQINRDMEDLFGDEEKPRCHTLLTGTPSLILFHAMNDSVIGPSVRDAYMNTELTLKDAIAVANSIKSSGAVSKCKDAIEDCKRKAYEVLSDLPDDRYRAALLEFIGSL